MAQASHQQFNKTQSQSPVTIPYFWIFLVVLDLLLLIDEIQFSNQKWFIFLFLVRLAQILVAFFAATSIYFKKEISPDYASLYFLFSLAFGSCFALFEGGDNLNRVNINALFYLFLAFSYRGEKRDWVQIYLPVSIFLLLIPVGLRFLSLVSPSHLIFIVLSLVLGNISIFFKSYFISDSFGQIVSEGDPEMEIEMKREDSFKNDSELGIESYLASSFLAAHKSLMQNEFSAESFYCQDLVHLVQEAVAFEAAKYKNFPKTQIVFHVPKYIPNNVWVKAEASELKALTHQLIDEAAVSLGMQTGVVRVSVQFTLKQMMIYVEDNGRGLGSEALMKLKIKNHADVDYKKLLSPTEMRALLKFWGGDFEMATRIGVGRRVCLSLPMREVTIRAKNSFLDFNQLSLSDA